MPHLSRANCGSWLRKVARPAQSLDKQPDTFSCSTGSSSDVRRKNKFLGLHFNHECFGEYSLNVKDCRQDRLWVTRGVSINGDVSVTTAFYKREITRLRLIDATFLLVRKTRQVEAQREAKSRVSYLCGHFLASP